MSRRIILLLFVFMFAFSVQASAASPLEEEINKLIGIDYKWGGEDPDGFDCSGFTKYVFAQFGIELPHWSKGQSYKGNPVAKENMRAGDLVFFNTSGQGISHVGIYLGNDQFAHASNSGVMISSMNEDYYAKRYVKSRRILGLYYYERIAIDVEEKDAKQAG
ncbi:C40 family peptidase [Marinicrinis sediminis]|uniref:C40 family peptidase n=1 Tax=Marinicrinis sediminis TaxID=1652465 RepID=A0ABW5RFW6_9BACL